MMKVIEHLKLFYSTYLLVVGLSGSSVGVYKVYDDVMTEIKSTKESTYYNQMLLFEFIVSSIEKEHGDSKFSDLEWQYYSIQANTLEGLQERFNRNSGWSKKERK